MPLRILYVGSLEGTCRHRAEALEQLGHRLEIVESDVPRDFWRFQIHRLGHRLRHPPDLHGAGRAVRRALEERSFDVVWIDKGLALGRRLLAAICRRADDAVVVNFSPDNMASRGWNSAPFLRALPLYDLHVTTKSYVVPELEALGARRVFFVDQGFDPEAHRPIELGEEERRRFACDVGFVGIYEEERADVLRRLGEAGIRVAIHGPGWKAVSGDPLLDLRGPYLQGLDYTRAICATRINLGFLRKGARDRQTTRSIEIPACGGFLLAERTDEHQRLFEEGREAEFFGDFDELLRKCRHYLAHEEERLRIAAAGRRRCFDSGYRYVDRVESIIREIDAIRKERAGGTTR